MKARNWCASWSALALAAVIGGCPAPPDVDADANDAGVVDGVTDGEGPTGTPGGPMGEPGNNAPLVFVAVSPQGAVAPGQTVTLDASSSSDPDGDELTFAWEQTAGPSAALENASAAQTSFVAPHVVENSELRFTVTVDDGRGGVISAEAAVSIEVSGEFLGDPQSAAPYRDTLSREEAYHLLRRAAFGARPEDVDLAVQRGLAATVDDLLTYKQPDAALVQLAESYEDNIPRRWMVYLLEGPNPLYERMAMFWHDRFATSRRVLSGRDRNLAVLHWKMLRDNALGDYRAFLEALTLDPLMLIWLDGANSPKQSPNENYTREFWELFTLGRDVLYTETDIREGARAFTGITLLRESGQDARPIFDLLNHDETDKMVFPDRAHPANHNYQSIIDLTLAQPEAAQYVARNLFEFFIHDEPSDQTVQELADLFAASGFQIKPLVRAILMSQAMFSPAARGNQIASPVEHIVGVARTLDMHMASEDSQGYVLDRLTRDLADAGQDLLNPPGVEGWKEGAAWLEDQWVIHRVRALGRTMEYGPNRDELPYHLLPPVSRWGDRDIRKQIVQALAGVFHLDLTEAEEDIYVEVLDQNGYRAFHLTDPQQQPQHVFEMIRLMAMDERVLGR
ncbi:MAG: DUF1800 family protein [Planctomycetota bacterium]|nr:MAG: DUF1800 family protein [Planctomycetota bacterium]